MQIFSTNNRKEWRDFLEKNFETLDEVWFVFPMKITNEDTLSYNDAVEEALCFGWIDSVNKHLDETHCIRRFSPRKKNSPYSQPNIERLKWLEEKELIHPKVRKKLLPIINKPFKYPRDIINKLKKDDVVWENYQRFAEPYKRIRIAYIASARNRKEEFKKRLNAFINKTRQGKLIQGYGGVDKYYK